jgi:hypothetical protein
VLAAEAPAQAPSASWRSASWFVWAVWAVMLLAALVFAGRYSGNVPFWDDWNLVPVLTGNQRLTGAWLWEQINEHRVPLPKLVLLSLYRVTANDFRAGIFFNVVALSALALGMIVAARRLRGRTSYADAFFPLVLLNWEHYETFLVSFALNLVVPTALAGLMLLIITRTPIAFRAATAIPAGVCLLLLPLCGANGVALVPALALWLGYMGWLRWRSADSSGKRDGLLMGGLAVVALVLVVLYFAGYEKPYYTYDPRLMGPWEYLRTSVQFLCMSFGSALRLVWPFSGLVVIALLFLTLLVLGRAWWEQPPERLRALGLLLFLAAMFSLALGLGWGRSTAGPFGGFQSRYATLAVPTLCCVYFAWVLYGSPAIRPFAEVGLFALACALLPFNTRNGLTHARVHGRQMAAFAKDLGAGVPEYLLLRRYGPFLFFSLNERLGEGMLMLHEARIGLFRSLRMNPPFRTVPLSVAPAALEDMTWKGDTGRGSGKDPAVLFALPEPTDVAGIRITYSYPDSKGNPIYFRMFWRDRDRNAFGEDRSYLNAFLERSTQERTVTVWIGEKIDEFRIHPDNPSSAVKISRIELLLETEAQPRPPALELRGRDWVRLGARAWAPACVPLGGRKTHGWPRKQV